MSRDDTSMALNPIEPPPASLEDKRAAIAAAPAGTVDVAAPRKPGRPRKVVAAPIVVEAPKPATVLTAETASQFSLDEMKATIEFAKLVANEAMNAAVVAEATVVELQKIATDEMKIRRTALEQEISVRRAALDSMKF